MRITSIGCAAAGIHSSAALTFAGRPRSAFELGLVGGEFSLRRQLFMHEQIRDFFELAVARDVENVVAAVMQIVAGLANRAQRRVASRSRRTARRIFFGLNAPALVVLVLLSASLIVVSRMR